MKVMDQVSASLGPDAMILRTSETEPFAGYGTVLEVTAAAGSDVDRLRESLFVDARPPSREKGQRPRVLAFVGPAGSGKTTAVLKLMADAAEHGDVRLGVLTLDTFRSGALEEIVAHARVHRARLEVAYTEKEVDGCLRRLRSCDAVLVDVPGLGRFEDDEWIEMLRAAKPDETHLVLPATLRRDVAQSILARAERLRPSHLLLTHLDELPGDVGLADLMLALGIPSRWVGAGARVDESLAPAAGRGFRSLGLAAPNPEPMLEVV
jgi:flagellar biosynthesis protein FlhF